MKVRILIAALPLVAVSVVACALAVAHASGGSQEHLTVTASPVPDWFLPIADAYDRNPAVTPNTDFAVLHFGDITSVTSTASRSRSSLDATQGGWGTRK